MKHQNYTFEASELDSANWSIKSEKEHDQIKKNILITSITSRINCWTSACRLNFVYKNFGRSQVSAEQINNWIFQTNQTARLSYSKWPLLMHQKFKIQMLCARKNKFFRRIQERKFEMAN